MSPSIIVLDVVVVLCATATALKLYQSWSKNFRSRGLRLPPGPKPSPIPLIGNLFDMPASREWLSFSAWRKQYGDLVSVEVMGRRICIINSYKAATDLLNGRSNIYSDRPAMPMVNDLMGWNFNMGLQPFGPVWKKHRQIFDRGFSRVATQEYQPIQTREITVLLQKLVESPEKYDDHLRVTSGAIVMMIAFGYKITDNDEFVRIAEEAQLAMVSAARPGAYFVDFLPFLKYVPEWFPGADFKRVAREGWELAQDLQDKPFAWAMKQLNEGHAEPSFFRKLMETASGDAVEEEKAIKCVCAVLYATGADTMLSSVLTFVLGMLHSPEAQEKAQKEIDNVVGNDRLPTFADRHALPYVTAIAKEALRWESVIPLGVPHRLTKDDVYGDYFIPAGTTMIANQWCIVISFQSHDESMYRRPMEFRPERFLEERAQDPNSIAFGWGHRKCPGRFLAADSLWLHVAVILASFKISRSIGPDGQDIIPPRDYTSGLASRPKPFPCRITPRNEASKHLIAQSVATVE